MDALLNSFQQDRRICKRHDIKTALRIRIWKSKIPEQRAEYINLSERGIKSRVQLQFCGQAIEDHRCQYGGTAHQDAQHDSSRILRWGLLAFGSVHESHSWRRLGRTVFTAEIKWVFTSAA